MMSIYGDEDVVDDEAIDSPAQETFEETDKQRTRREYFGSKAGKAWLKNRKQQTGASNAELERQFNVDLNNDNQIGDGEQVEEGQEGTIGDAEIIMDETVPRVQERQPVPEFSIFGTGEFQPNTDALDLIGMKPSNTQEPNIVFAAKGFKKRVKEPTIIFAGESGEEDIMIKPVRSRASGKKPRSSKAPKMNDIMGFGSIKGKGKRFRFL